MPSGNVFKQYEERTKDDGKHPVSNPKFIQYLSVEYGLYTKPTNGRDEHGNPKTIRLFHIEEGRGVVNDGGN